MIQINRDEALALMAQGIHCPKTCRLKRNGSKRGKYFCPNDKNALEALESYRAEQAEKYHKANKNR